ncbi:hypothetical protein Nmel_017084 [Mimus melanotis]
MPWLRNSIPPAPAMHPQICRAKNPRVPAKDAPGRINSAPASLCRRAMGGLAQSSQWWWLFPQQVQAPSIHQCLPFPTFRAHLW